MAIHERVWERADAGRDPPPAVDRPVGTYGLLGAMVAVYVAQFVVLLTYGVGLHNRIFAIGPDWYVTPWTVVTSTLSHSPGTIFHILFNGLVLYFFGPHLERLVGTVRFLVLFFAAGALAGILQVTIDPGLALGASGAIQMVFGALVVIMPQAKLLLWGIVPMRFWMAAVGFVLLDVLGFLGYGDPDIANVAHLAGFALGLLVGYRTKKDLEARGLRIHYAT